MKWHNLKEGKQGLENAHMWEALESSIQVIVEDKGYAKREQPMPMCEEEELGAKILFYCIVYSKASSILQHLVFECPSSPQKL